MHLANMEQVYEYIIQHDLEITISVVKLINQICVRVLGKVNVQKYHYQIVVSRIDLGLLTGNQLTLYQRLLYGYDKEINKQQIINNNTSINTQQFIKDSQFVPNIGEFPNPLLGEQPLYTNI